MAKRKSWFAFGVTAVVLSLSLIFWSGCSESFDQPTDPGAQQEIGVFDGQEIVLSKTNPQVQRVMAVQERHTDQLMANTNVVGTATSMTEDGKPAILVMLKTDAKKDAALSKIAPIPTEIEGVAVVTLVTGEIKAIKGPPGGGGFDPTDKHRPAPNGVSLGHPDITAGTLGCLVESGNNTYILSNNHVMANENNASIGDDILQPGPFDGGGAGDEIATLSDYEAIVFSTSANNVIDAAIAAVDPADVTGETVSYGAPNTTTSSASVNMRVEKYGRTTESTKGRVQGINATVNVGYDTGVARFVNQIVIGGGGFSSGGDSGSLIVVQKGSDAGNPVGLLFAGGGGTTIANPIDDVLSAFNVTVVGN